jgi:hypothetical protein
MTAILVRFPDESIKLDDVEEQRVLTTLEVIYDGGSLHSKTADFPYARPRAPGGWPSPRNWHFFETYERTICVDIRSGRTIFRYAGITSKANSSTWWKRLLAGLGIRKFRTIEI